MTTSIVAPPIPQSRIDTLNRLAREAEHLLASIEALPEITTGAEQLAVLRNDAQRVYDALRNLTVQVTWERAKRIARGGAEVL